MKVFLKVLGTYTAVVLIVLAGVNMHQNLVNNASIKPIIVTRQPRTASPEPGTPTTQLASSAHKPTSKSTASSSGAKATNNQSPTNTCSPATALPSLKLPTLSVSQPGLHQAQTVAAIYAVHGDTASQINGQLFTCSPVKIGGERFAASTDYTLGWTFDYTSSDGLTCTIQNVSVGLALSQVYPVWQGDSAGVKSAWNSFIANLTTHENGHASLDKTYAQRVLDDLQNLPATNCETIVQTANATANADVKALDLANNSYDATTQHGATQGAILK